MLYRLTQDPCDSRIPAFFCLAEAQQWVMEDGRRCFIICQPSPQTHKSSGNKSISQGYNNCNNTLGSA